MNILKPKYLIPFSTIFIGGYYLRNFMEDVYFRRYRFIQKLARSYFTSDDGTSVFHDSLIGNIVACSDRMHLYFGGMNNYISSKFSEPAAIIFVTKIESIKLILNKAAKYGFKVAIMDVDGIYDYKRKLSNKFNLSISEVKRLTRFKNPFLIINLKKITHKEYDDKTFTIKAGVGNTVDELNQYLAKFGRRLPFQSKEKLYTVISDNSISINSFKFRSLSDIITGIIAVSPDDVLIISPGNDQKITYGTGLDLNQIFIGQQNKYGILYQVTLQTEPIENSIKNSYQIQNNQLTKTLIYQITQQYQQQIENNNNIKLQFNKDQKSNDWSMVIEAQTQQDINQFFKQYHYLNQYIKNTDKINQIQQQQGDRSFEIIYQIHPSSLIECLFLLRSYDNYNQSNTLQWAIDMQSGYLKLNSKGYQADKKMFLSKIKEITHFICNRKGKFIKCNDTLMNRLLMIETLPLQLGLAGLKFEQKIADVFDKDRVLFHETKQHKEFQEVQDKS